MKLRIGFRDPSRVIGWEYNLDLNLIGAGAKEDPFIITPPNYTNSDYYYKRFNHSLELSDSKSYFEVRNYGLRAIILVNCANTTILKSCITKIMLKNCSNILIKKCTIEKILTIFIGP